MLSRSKMILHSPIHFHHNFKFMSFIITQGHRSVNVSPSGLWSSSLLFRHQNVQSCHERRKTRVIFIIKIIFIGIQQRKVIKQRQLVIFQKVCYMLKRAPLPCSQLSTTIQILEICYVFSFQAPRNHQKGQLIISRVSEASKSVSDHSSPFIQLNFFSKGWIPSFRVFNYIFGFIYVQLASFGKTLISSYKTLIHHP